MFVCSVQAEGGMGGLCRTPDGSGGDSWSYKAPVKSSPPTNVVDKDVNDLCFKPSDAVDRSKRGK